jgi:hypothetical protein
MSLGDCLRNSTYTDTRGSSFNDIGGDQNIHNTTIKQQNIHINVSLTGPGQSLHQVLDNVNNGLRVSSGASQRKALAHYEANSGSDVAARLIVDIVQLLMDRGFSDCYQDLKQELEVLHQTLTLTELAIQAYEYTPLGRNLANIFGEEAKRCSVVLRELLDTMNGCRRGLDPTRINHLWSRVWWSGYDVNEWSSLRLKLSAHQRSLCVCLKALNS